MPIQVNLVVHGEAAMPAMSVCPAPARRGIGSIEGWFDVTTIAVARDPYRQRFVEASDAAFIAW